MPERKKRKKFTETQLKNTVEGGWVQERNKWIFGTGTSSQRSGLQKNKCGSISDGGAAD